MRPTRPVRRGRQLKASLSSHHLDISSQLLEAIAQEKTSVVRRLLSSGADPNVCSTAPTRDPALVLACSATSAPNTRRDIVSLLLDRGARVHLPNSTGQIALMLAATTGDSETCKLLLDTGAMVGVEDCDGNTALSYAARSGHEEVTRMIVNASKRQGVNVDHRNMRGLTALLLSCQNGHLSTARILVQEGGASPSVRDLDNFMTAAEWMKRSGHYSESELKFLFPVSRKKSYYRRQRQEKGLKILSDYLSPPEAGAPANVFTISQPVEADSAKYLQRRSISPSPRNEQGSLRSMFDVPSHTASDTVPAPFRKKSILPPLAQSRDRHSKPKPSNDFKPELYHLHYLKKRQLYIAPNRQSGCFHTGSLEPLAGDRLQRLQVVEEDREGGQGRERIHSGREGRKTKHRPLPPLK